MYYNYNFRFTFVWIFRPNIHLNSTRWSTYSSTDETYPAGLIVSRLLYALPAWGMLVSAGQAGRADVFLKRAHKWGFCKDIVTFNELSIKSSSSLFKRCTQQYTVLTLCFHPKRKPTISSETGTAVTHCRNWLVSTVGRTSVFGRRTDPVLASACSRRVTTMWVSRPL